MNVIALIFMSLAMLLLCAAVAFFVEWREARRQLDYWRCVALDEIARSERAEQQLAALGHQPSTLNDQPRSNG